MYRYALMMMLVAGPAGAQEPKVTRITLHAPPSAQSMLEYRLLPELRDMRSGNAAGHYFRSFSFETMNAFLGKEAREKIDSALSTPLDKLRGEEPGQLGSPYALAAFREGALCTSCDWDMINRARREGYMLLIPEVQAMRLPQKMVLARARLAIAQGDFTAAHDFARTSFAAARHIAEGDCLIMGLVGLASAAGTLEQLEAWVGQPNAPSLYWPLTDLPSPLIDLRRPLEGERLLFDTIIPGYRDAKPGKFRLDHDRFSKYAGAISSDQGKSDWGQVANVAAALPAARALLKRRGWTDEHLNATPALDLVALKMAHDYDQGIEEQMIALSLPPAEAFRRLADIKKRIGNRDNAFEGQSMAATLLPAMSKVYTSRLKVERRVAALRTIEAIRLHVAETKELPASLADIKVVPVPVDPLTGMDFEYRREGPGARLTVGAPPPLLGSDVITYELTKP